LYNHKETSQSTSASQPKQSRSDGGFDRTGWEEDVTPTADTQFGGAPKSMIEVRLSSILF